MQPLVSVILPAYNAQEHLKEAIESILQQTYQNFELIILNDGSDDQTEQIINSFSDKRIINIKNEKNLGLIATLNKGIDLSKGEFIARMDSDDISMPIRLEKQVSFMLAHPEIGASGSDYYSMAGTSLKKMHTYSAHGELRALLLFNSCLCHPTTIIRKNILSQNNFHYRAAYKHAEDYELWIQVSRVSQLANIPEILLKYRYHQGQISLAHNSEQKRNASIIRENYLKTLSFSFSAEEFKTHTLLAENRFITLPDELDNAEKWLMSLVEQNTRLNSIDPKCFNRIMAKIWLDTCGNTGLGFVAYKRFFRSTLAGLYPLSFKQRSKLAVKCLLRRFKK